MFLEIVEHSFAIAPLAIGALIGAGLGLLKGKGDKEQERRDRALAAETARWSPWTGMQAQMPQNVSMAGEVLKGGATGAMMGQGMGGDTKLAQPNMGLSGGPVAAGTGGAMMSPNMTPQQYQTWMMMQR